MTDFTIDLQVFWYNSPWLVHLALMIVSLILAGVAIWYSPPLTRRRDRRRFLAADAALQKRQAP